MIGPRREIRTAQNVLYVLFGHRLSPGRTSGLLTLLSNWYAVVGTANGSGSCATITATIQFQRIRAKKLYLLLSIAEGSRAARHQEPADQTTKSPNSSDCYVRSPGPGTGRNYTVVIGAVFPLNCLLHNENGQRQALSGSADSYRHKGAPHPDPDHPSSRRMGARLWGG